MQWPAMHLFSGKNHLAKFDEQNQSPPNERVDCTIVKTVQPRVRSSSTGSHERTRFPRLGIG